MQHMKCDICGFSAGYFRHERRSGLMLCAECIVRRDVARFNTISSLNNKIYPLKDSQPGFASSAAKLGGGLSFSSSGSNFKKTTTPGTGGLKQLKLFGNG